MAVPVSLQSRATTLLSTHPSFGREADRRAVLLSAGLDDALIVQIDVSGTPFTFVAQLMETLSEYGTLHDGRDALEAFLLASQGFFGVEGVEELNEMIKEWSGVRNAAPAQDPQVRRYLTVLAKRWDERNSPLLPDDVRLADVAVPLRVLNTARHSEEPPSNKGLRLPPTRDVISAPIEVQALLSGTPNEERWLLFGDPGTGKTTLAVREAARMSTAALDDESPLVPVFISLSQFGQRMTENPRYTLYEHITEIGDAAGVSGLGAELRRIARRGQVVFFLDGADEVPEELRETALNAIHAGSFPDVGNRLLVTSRRVGASQFVGYRRLDMAPLTIDDQRKLMLVVCGEEKTQRLLAEMSARPEVQEMARVPMMLSVLALVARETEDFNGDYFRRHTDLFKVAVRVLLEGRHRARHKVLDPYAAEALMATASLVLHDMSAQTAGEETFRDSQVEQAVRQADDGRLQKWGGPREFIDDVSSVSNIIFPIDTLGTRYRYLHRTMREFLAALALSQFTPQERRDTVEIVLNQQAWAEVLVLLGGLVNDVDEYLLQLLQGPPDLALRTLKEVDSLDPAMAAKVLQLRPMRLRNRRQVFVEMVRKLPNSAAVIDVLWAYLNAAQHELPRVDLFFIDDTLRTLGGPLAEELREHIFDFMPPVPDDLFALPPHLQQYGTYWCDVPAGPCLIGADVDDPDRPPWVPVLQEFDLPGYQIGRVPVTNAIYERFDPHHRVIRDFQEQVESAELDHHPAVGISWYEAEAFAMWAGRAVEGLRLPSEFEWEKAASWDGTAKRRFPWGDEWDNTRLNMWESGPNRTSLVGEYPDGASPVGALDVAGNVWEWCLNWFEEDVTPVTAREPSLLGDRRVDRGGGWYHDVGRPCTFLRAADDPADQFSHCGFRLVRGAVPLSRGMDMAADIVGVAPAAPQAPVQQAPAQQDIPDQRRRRPRWLPGGRK